MSDHPVWDVYNEYRTARLNVKYHGALLRRLKQKNFWMEIILAITAPSSAVAGLLFWNTPAGAWVWQLLGMISAFLAVSKPLLNFTEKIGKLEEVLTGYKALDHDYQRLSIEIRQTQRYDKQMQKIFYGLLDKKKTLITSSTVETSDTALQKQCENEVKLELPVDSFCIPKEDQS